MLTKNLLKTLGVIALATVFIFSLAACSGSGNNLVSPAIDGGGGGSGKGADPGQGSGAENDPLVIRTPSDLEKIGDRLEEGDEPDGLYYELVDDVDLSDYGPTYNGGKGWKPIGDRNTPFKGHFNGNGKKIKNLYIDDSGRDDAGLFGVIEGGTVENLVIEDANITGGDNVGGVAGQLIDSDVTDCYVTGQIKGNDNVGGIAGSASEGSNIRNCYVGADVSGNDNVGGLAGLLTDSTVINCYVTGEIGGANNIGGVAGNVSDNSSVSNSYAAGEVGGVGAVGGVAGNIVASGSVVGNVALNPVITQKSGAATTFGRVAGEVSASAAINNAAYDDMEIFGATVSGGAANNQNGVDITRVAATTVSPNYYYTSFTWLFGADVDNPWKWGGTSYPLPVLYWQTGGIMPANPPSHLVDPGVAGGDGTEGNPLIVGSASFLKDLAEKVNNGTELGGRYYKLADNIDLSVYAGDNGGKGWAPIGTDGNRFSGHFDGNGKTVSNLFIDDDTLNHVGLFGYMNGGSVKNLGIENVNITGHQYTGGLVGRTDGSKISNCYVTGEINGDNYVGGLLGGAAGTSEVSNCYFMGEVNGSSFVGGVAGRLDNSIASKCYVTGVVRGEDHVGGVAGSVVNSSLTDSAALNESIINLLGGTSFFGRVAGMESSATLNNNVAYSGMTVAGVGASSIDDTSIDGLDVISADLKLQTYYTGLGWAFGTIETSPWKWAGPSYTLPVLNFQATTPVFPAYLN